MNCLKVVPTAAIRFVSFEGYKTMLSRDGLVPAWAKGAAGGAAGTTALLATYPLDLVRTRLSLPQHPYRGLVHACTTIAREEGFRGFYKGAPAALLSVAPFSGINFMTYETLKEAVYRVNPDPPTIYMSACGAISGGVAMTVLYPLDLLKRQMMLQGQGGRPREYRNWGHAVLTIWAKSGINGFYRGLFASYWKVIPTTSITFYTYEVMKKYLEV